MAQKVKICPVCGVQNPVESVSCLGCGYILTNVTPTSVSNDASSNVSGVETIKPSVFQMDVTMREARKYVILKFGDNEIQVFDGEVIGRHGKGSEFFKDILEVSRRHAKITFDGSDAYITDLNSTNGVYINGELIKPGVPVKIDVGAKIRLCSKVTLEVLKIQLPGANIPSQLSSSDKVQIFSHDVSISSPPMRAEGTQSVAESEKTSSNETSMPGTATRRCKNCGRELKEGEKICPSCLEYVE